MGVDGGVLCIRDKNVLASHPCHGASLLHAAVFISRFLHFASRIIGIFSSPKARRQHRKAVSKIELLTECSPEDEI